MALPELALTVHADVAMDFQDNFVRFLPICVPASIVTGMAAAVQDYANVIMDSLEPIVKQIFATELIAMGGEHASMVVALVTTDTPEHSAKLCRINVLE